ncbi:MAG TPA: hypothetical protein VFE02_14815 [Candidatus Acidoferrales bacterium]|jgi:hypothetical protein|nr:hypothetical protein [Candidatus Acidoferrales bacterium]
MLPIRVAAKLILLLKEAYLTMPIGVLYVFQPAQDCGCAHAQPVNLVEARNHVRVRKSPHEWTADESSASPRRSTSASSAISAIMV